jgi:hypothetical protein
VRAKVSQYELVSMDRGQRLTAETNLSLHKFIWNDRSSQVFKAFFDVGALC